MKVLNLVGFCGCIGSLIASFLQLISGWCLVLVSSSGACLNGCLLVVDLVPGCACARIEDRNPLEVFVCYFMEFCCCLRSAGSPLCRSWKITEDLNSIK